MATLAKNNPDIVILKVNINEPGSPVARQYGIQAIPVFEVYDGNGKLVAEGKEAVDWIDQAMRKANLTD